MTIYEIVTKGFTGDTDETDDKIIWIKFNSPLPVEIKIKNTNDSIIQSINKINFPNPSNVPEEAFDLIVS